MSELKSHRNHPWRLTLLAGLLAGLSLGAKWSIAPALMLPGVLFLVLKRSEKA